MTSSEFSATSHKASIETAAQSRQSAARRGKTSASSPQNTKPWSTCVKVNEPSSCWELSELQASPDHKQRPSQGRHHGRPWLRSKYAVPTRTTTMASHGIILLIVRHRICDCDACF